MNKDNMRKESTKNEDLVDYIFELGLQKHVKRSGWWVAGVKDPETIAEHSQRAALIAYILAEIEGANPDKSALICMIHDIPECRINDGHKIVNRYFDLRKGEEAAMKDQLELLPDKISRRFKELFREFMDQSSKEGIIAKDADYLECAFQAKEYLDIGHECAKDWIKNAGERLKTKTAKELFDIMVKIGSKKWFEGLKELK